MDWKRGRGGLDELIETSWPIVVGMLSYTAMGVADTWLVSQLGTREVAAVGIAATAYFTANSFAIGLLSAVKVLVSQAFGAGKTQRMRRAGWLGVAAVLPLGLGSLLLGQCGGQLFALLGGSAEVQALAQEYFGIRVWGSGCWFLVLAVSSFLQARGEVKLPMKLTLLANFTNVPLSAALVFGWGPFPELGVRGAALGSALSWLLASLPAGWLFLRRAGPWPRKVGAQLGRFLRVGLPIGVRRVIEVTGFLAFTAMIARLGDEQLAAHQVTLRIISLSFLPGHGIGEAACVLIGKYVGAKDIPAARRAFGCAVGLAVTVMGSAGVLFLVVPEGLLGMFLQDVGVLAIGRQLMGVAALFQVFDAVALSASGALNGGGDTRFTMVVGIAGSWLVCVPGAYLFGIALSMGAVGAWLGLTADVTTQAVVLLARFRSGRWHGDAGSTAPPAPAHA